LAFGEEVKCDSRDCPVFYTRVREDSAVVAFRERVGGVIKVLEEREPEKEIEW
jgi:DNA polymerase zeta